MRVDDFLLFREFEELLVHLFRRRSGIGRLQKLAISLKQPLSLGGKKGSELAPRLLRSAILNFSVNLRALLRPTGQW